MHAGAEGADADHVTGREEIYLGEDRATRSLRAYGDRRRRQPGDRERPARPARPAVLPRQLIAYSLGNFAGYGNFSIHGTMTMSAILRVTLSSSGRFERARLDPVPVRRTGRPVPGGGAISLVARLSSADFGASAARVRSSGVITPAR